MCQIIIFIRVVICLTFHKISPNHPYYSKVCHSKQHKCLLKIRPIRADNFIWLFIGEKAVVTIEFQYLQLPVKAFLCFVAGASQGGWVGGPTLNALGIVLPVLVIYNKRSDVMPKAFLYHNQSTDTAIIVIKWVYPFKAHMEVQNGIEIHRLSFV